MPTTPPRVLFLSAAEVRQLLAMDECIQAVEAAFRAQAEGRVIPPGVLSSHTGTGAFHTKAAGLTLDRPYYVAKTNANFPGNAERFGLPTIQGIIVLFDAERGTPLALLDSGEITAVRTAAATAVAAKYLAAPDAERAAIVGCGVQARWQLRALAAVRPLRSVLATDSDTERAAGFAQDMGYELGIDVRAVPTIEDAAPPSTIVVTCTTSKRWLLGARHVAPGAFVAAVGADNPHKQELEPALMAASTVVVDVLEQCAEIGDLHHAIEAGAMTTNDVHAELGDVVAKRAPGRSRADEIIVFDSTGTALQDVAAAVLVYRKALERRMGKMLEL
jgi:ornithine cyclodeaminase/alanine dehydrogenase-like protein (mu-crystallin family)